MNEDELNEDPSGAAVGSADLETNPDFEDEVEYDENGNPVEAEPEVAVETQAEAPAPRTAPSFNLSGMTQAQRDEINELAMTDSVAAFERYLEFREQQNTQRGQLTDFHAETLEATAPELMRKYGKDIRTGIAEYSKQFPGSEDAVNVGVANALLQALRKNKDVKAVVGEFHAALNGQAAAPAAKPARAPLPAGQRVARPSLSGEGRGSAPAPAASRNAPAGKVKVLMEFHGLTRAEAERAANA